LFTTFRRNSSAIVVLGVSATAVFIPSYSPGLAYAIACVMALIQDDDIELDGDGCLRRLS
jgi:hypothetical protein